MTEREPKRETETPQRDRHLELYLSIDISFLEISLNQGSLATKYKTRTTGFKILKTAAPS